MYLDDFTISTTNLDIPDLIDCWKWLLKKIDKVLLISKLGDMFLIGQNDAIYWLATDTGTLTTIANSTEEFEQLLQDEENLDNWFLPSLLEQLHEAGKMLKQNQVYSFKMMPIIGGEYTVENIEPTDISVHFTFTGQIFEQVKDLPDGTPIKIKLDK
jgi:hypothetical protein